MKKLFLILFSLILSGNFAIAEDLWDNYGDTNTYNQKSVTDEEFEKAIESKTRKKKNKKIPKGNESHQSNETQFLKEAKEDLPVLCLPTNIILEDKILPVGHYQIVGEKKDNKPVIKLYQAHFLIGEIPTTETQDDFNKETVTFVDVVENGENQIKIIYGSIDFNAYAIVNIAHEQ